VGQIINGLLLLCRVCTDNKNVYVQGETKEYTTFTFSHQHKNKHIS